MNINLNNFDDMESISTSDLQLLADVAHDGTDINLQVMGYDDFIHTKYCYKSRLTLIINIDKQWNTVIIDKNYISYLAYSKRGAQEKIMNHLERNVTFKETFLDNFSSKNWKTIYLKNDNGISAVIISKLINDMIDNSQFKNVLISDIKKMVSNELRLDLLNLLIMSRKTQNLLINVTEDSSYEPKVTKPVKKLDLYKPELPSKSPAKVPKLSSDDPRPLVKETDGFSKVIIRSTDPMTEEKLILHFRKYIKVSIGLIEENGFVPRLRDLSCIHAGVLILTCEDVRSLQWLKQELPKNSMKLTILPVICNAYIPKSHVDTVEEAFNLIKKQNHGLNTDLWYILDCLSDRNGFSICAGIDEFSADVLCNSEWKARLSTTDITFVRNNCISLVSKIRDIETTPETVVINPNNGSHSSCAVSLTTNTAATVKTSGHEVGSEPQVRENEPSTSLASSRLADIETAQVAQTNPNLPENPNFPLSRSTDNLSLQATVINTTAAATSPDQTSEEERDYIAQGDQSIINANLPLRPSSRTSTPNRPHEPQRGHEAQTASSEYIDLSHVENIMSQEGQIIENPSISVEILCGQHNNHLTSSLPVPTSSTSGTEQPTQAMQFFTERSLHDTSSPRESHSLRPTAPTGHQQQRRPESQTERNAAIGPSRRNNGMSQEGRRYSDPPSVVGIPRVQKNNSGSSRSTSTIAAMEQLSAAAQSSTRRSQHDTLSPREIHSLISVAAQSSTRRSQHDTLSPREIHSLWATAITGREQQRRPESQTERSAAIGPSRRNNGMSQEVRRYSDPTSVVGIPRVQQNNSGSSRSTSSMAAMEQPSEAAQSSTRRSQHDTSSPRGTHSLRPTAPTVNAQQRRPETQTERSLAIGSSPRNNGMSQYGGAYYLNQSSQMGISNVQQIYLTSSQSTSTHTAATVEQPNLTRQTSMRSQRETLSSRGTHSLPLPAPTRHNQQRRPVSHAERVDVPFENEDDLLRQLYSQMDIIHYGTHK